MKFDIKDVVRTTYTPGTHIRYHHLPTGIVVERSILAGCKMFQLDRELMKELIEKVENYE